MTSRNQQDEWNYGGAGSNRGRDMGAPSSAPSDDCDDENCPEDPKLITAELAIQRKELSKSRSQQGPTTSAAGVKRLNPNKCPKPGEPRPSRQEPCRTDSEGKLVCDRGTETDSKPGTSTGPPCRCGPELDPHSRTFFPLDENRGYPEQQSRREGGQSTPSAGFQYADMSPEDNDSFNTPGAMATSTPRRYHPRPYQFFPKRKRHANGLVFADQDDNAWDDSDVATSERDRTEAPNFQVQHTDESVILTVAPTRPGDTSLQVVISKPPSQNTSGAGAWAYNVAPFDDESGIYPLPEDTPRVNTSQPSSVRLSPRAGPSTPLNRTGEQISGPSPWNYAVVAPEEASGLYEDYRDYSFRQAVRGPTSPRSTGGNRSAPLWPHDDLSNLFPPDNDPNTSRRNESQRTGVLLKGPRNPRTVASPGNRSGQQNVTAQTSWPYRDGPKSPRKPVATGGSPGNRRVPHSWPHDDPSESYASFPPDNTADQSVQSHRTAPLSSRAQVGNRTQQNISQNATPPWPYPPTPLDELSSMFPSDDGSTAENSRGTQASSKPGGTSSNRSGYK